MPPLCSPWLLLRRARRAACLPRGSVACVRLQLQYLTAEDRHALVNRIAALPACSAVARRKLYAVDDVRQRKVRASLEKLCNAPATLEVRAAFIAPVCRVVLAHSGLLIASPPCHLSARGDDGAPNDRQSGCE